MKIKGWVNLNGSWVRVAHIVYVRQHLHPDLAIIGLACYGGRWTLEPNLSVAEVMALIAEAEAE